MTPPASGFEIRDLTVSYGRHRAVDSVSARIPAGAITAVIGPNGCGKSTLLRSLAGLVRGPRGHLLLDGRDLADLPPRLYAREVAMLPQAPLAPDGMTVAELVSRGRDPHRRLFRPWSAEDESVVQETLAATGLTDLAQRPLDSLSGGQRQRAWIAMTVAQRTRVMLLDEPTTYLDVAHQLEVLALIEELHSRSGATVVMVLHELSLAARHADHLIAMKDGRIVAAGPPADVVTERVLADVFGIEAEILADSRTGRPVVVPLGPAGEWRS
ncbi:ATP-binding cassette domain-containing protein [Rathayibacter sp. VKM Ac-2803]|uniref:ABC transporter ATP-binding protein n=1 Tax=unclassified Rathayibacter TaxID=2609250 RepID=UPI00135BE724|nr:MULTISPECIES: ABC transporter ATP-binding protein [unclassified Rathayibacter]MWV51147.1 ATP-binding cassette domain-containing protein [Rathayibacter sp. VKM Ac-2803]MWV57632.1 ATP-binding cassette domain-containing protein [Rathayibacter sp. VKM Ac-2754]